MGAKIPEMVERVADELGMYFSGADRAYREHHEAAKTALAVLREPTEAMVEAAARAAFAVDGGLDWEALRADDMREHFRKQVRAAFIAATRR